MSDEASLQTDHLVGHILPGIGYILLGIVLLIYVYDPDFLNEIKCLRKKNKPNNFKLIKITGYVLMIIGFVCFVLWMVDIGKGNYSTKIHRVLSCLVFPLGLTMIIEPKPYIQFPKGKNINQIDAKNAFKKVYKPTWNNTDQETAATYYSKLLDTTNTKLDDAWERTMINVDLNPQSYLWKEFLPIYCFMNALMYYGHRHTPEGNTMNMPNGEEEAHTILCWSFFAAFLFFGVSEYLAILRQQTVLFVFGSITFVIIGIWYCEIAGLLYGGRFGINGATYYDATSDFGITLLVTSIVMIIGYSCFFNIN